MAGRYDRNPFDEQEEVNPFANPGSVPAASKSRLSPLPPEPAGTVDIPLDRPGSGTQALKKKDKELQAKEAELRRREQDLKRKEDAAARAGIVIEAKNWSPCFPLIHHDIANEIPVRRQRLQHIAFPTYSGLVLTLFWLTISVTCNRFFVPSSTGRRIFYFIGFGLFCLETVVIIWIIQQLYMYFRGSGKADEMRRDAARGAKRAAI